MLKHVATLTVALFALSGCGREERPNTDRPPPSRAAALTAAPKAPAAGPTPPATGAAPRQPGIAEQLADEAGARPSGTVTVEDVVAALDAAGDPARHERQVLASTVSAHYCALLETRSGLLLSVCEFDSPAAAQTGLEVSRSRFDRLIPGRRFELNRSTLLTVTPREGGVTATASDPSGPARELFAALSPRMHERNEQ